ncbi:MAG TPA: hypothetical protein VF281_03055 [Candidatus Saccharimonadales bacterium]
MLDHEYRQKERIRRYKRSWPLTIIAGILSGLVMLGIVAVWRYVGHDGFIIATVIVPAAICGLMFLLAALNGRRETFRDAFDAIFSLMYWW